MYDPSFLSGRHRRPPPSTGVAAAHTFHDRSDTVPFGKPPHASVSLTPIWDPVLSMRWDRRRGREVCGLMDLKKALWGILGELLGYSWGIWGRRGKIGVLREDWGESGVRGCEGGSESLLPGWIAFCLADY